jgi:hypothetical protein
MVQDRAVLIWSKKWGRIAALTFFICTGLFFPASRLLSQQLTSSAPRVTIGLIWTRHLVGGGVGVSFGYTKKNIEVLAGAEIETAIWGLSLAGRYYLPSNAKTRPFISARTAYYKDKGHLGGRPGYHLNLHLSIGFQNYFSPRWSVQGQLGIGYAGYFRINGEPFFTPTWLPTRMLHVGLGYDLPLRQRPGPIESVADMQLPETSSGRFSLLLHTGLQINTLAPPSFERFTAGLAYDVHPRIGLTLRHQAVRTSDGLKYGKSLLGVRWMPGQGDGLRWLGSLEAGHWGSVLNFRSPIGAFGVVVGQHLQYPILSGIAVDLGLQYALLKAPQPLQPASSDFETSLGLVIRPGAWRKRI